MSTFLSELEQCIPALRRYAFTLFFNQEEADDLVQDCLEHALNKQSLWKPDTSLRAWLFTMQHNLYINQLRKQGRQPIMDVETEFLGHRLEPDKSDILMDDINRCIQQLPDEQRQVLLLVTVEGFTYQQVAKIIASPVGTVMSRLSRARNTLQILMGDNSTPATTSILRTIK